SRQYQVQVWVSDPRPVAGRTGTITGSNTVNMLYSVNNSAGSPGQYSIGSFSAGGTTQSFVMSSNGSTQINAIQVRDVTPANPSLLAYYTFDDASTTTILDSSGNNYNGTYNNGPGRAAGIVNSALALNGTNQNGPVPYNAALDPDAWTYAASIRRP